jgi:hypothetical protein
VEKRGLGVTKEPGKQHPLMLFSDSLVSMSAQLVLLSDSLMSMSAQLVLLSDSLVSMSAPL